MPKYDVNSLVTLRNNIDRYLTSIDERDSKVYQSFLTKVSDLKDEVARTVQNNTVDAKQIVGAIAQLEKTIHTAQMQKAIVYDPTIITLLRNIETLLKKPKEEKEIDRTDEIVKAIQNIKIKPTDIEFPDMINVGNFPPQVTPNPVTNININPLRGFIKTTTATVTSTVKALPEYGVLDNRRSMMIYNDSSNTIYVGGSDVTTSNGLPVPASSYSPIFDAGVHMIVYGIASTGSNNIRVLEISNDNIGG